MKARALERVPPLHFFDMSIFLGDHSIMFYWRNVSDLDAAETMVFDEGAVDGLSIVWQQRMLQSVKPFAPKL